MKYKFLFTFFIFLFFSNSAAAQQNPPPPRSAEPLVNISNDLSRISKSVADLNKKLQEFFDTFTTNQGLRLTERQQKMLLAFEILNRAEQRLATLSKLRIELVEKQTKTRNELARVEDEMRDENIERGLAVRGGLKADEVRDARRRVLTVEINSLRSLLGEIQNTLNETNTEIRQTEILINSIRPKLFREIEQELLDF